MKKKFKEIYNLALKSRIFQLHINELMKKKKFKLPIHLAFGHEFVSSIVKTNFNKRDKLLLSHRNIHFSSIFSKNVLKKYLRFSIRNNTEYYNSEGSMNYTDKNANIPYSSSVLGNNLSVACGVAKANKNKGGITICVTGDGAIEEGTFYESLILSKYLKLPLIFLIENNDWSMATSIKERRSNINFSYLAKSLGIKHYKFKRQNIKKNIFDYKIAVDRCRKNKLPVICEFEVKTLGTFISSGKKIHYHHGPMKLKNVNNIIGNPEDDIIYNIKHKLKI
jgi:TPP-dependent pyruvate/acetoin dehydrogenase alpha subunit